MTYSIGNLTRRPASATGRWQMKGKRKNEIEVSYIINMNSDIIWYDTHHRYLVTYLLPTYFIS